MGFVILYTVGFPPSRMPPCGAARRAVAVGATDEAAFVMTFETVDVKEDDMLSAGLGVSER